MNLVVDESVDRPVVDRLRRDGHEVLYVAELSPSIDDDTVLGRANEHDALLITADKDFGELVFRLRRVHSGVVLVRLAGMPPQTKARIVSDVLSSHAVSAEEGRKRNGRKPTKAFLQTRLAEKLVTVFRPEDRLGRLARQYKGRSRCEVDLRFSESGTSLASNFASQNKSEVVMDRSPSAWCETAPVFLPTRELLTIYPGFVPLYETHHLEFDETWCDTCLLLGSPPVKGVHERKANRLKNP